MTAHDEPHIAAIASVPIGRHRIGPGEPVFITAEAGVNHDGCVETALRLVDVAAEAGADAVKFQMFRADQLVTASAPTAAYQRVGTGAEAQRAMLARLELSLDGFAKVKARCEAVSVVFLATPFSPADLEHLIALGAPAVKIASTDLTNPPLLEAAARSTLPMILSTGASTAQEIRAAVDELRRWGAADRMMLMHCVSCYPTPLEALNLRAMAALQETYRVPCGLSDHTTSTRTGGWATAAGAQLVEKHVTLDRSASGPDHAMSLDPDQLATYVHEVREVERALGAGTLGMTESQSEVRRVAARSIVAAVDMAEGAKLTADALTLKRPGSGIAPHDLDRLIGRYAAVDIPCDTILTWDMVR